MKAGAILTVSFQSFHLIERISALTKKTVTIVKTNVICNIHVSEVHSYVSMRSDHTYIALALCVL